MTEDLHDFDKLFKAAIDGHEEAPSPASWNAIDKNLDNSNIVSIRKKYDNLKKLVVVLILFLSGGIVYEFYSAYSHGTTAANISVKKELTQDISSSKTSTKKELNYDNTVKGNTNIKNSNSLNQQTAVETGKTTQSIIIANKAILEKGVHHFAKVHTKGKFSSTILYGEVGRSENVGNTNASSKSNSSVKISNFNSTSLQLLPILAFIHTGATGFNIESTILQKSMLPKNILISNNSASNTQKIFKPSRFSATFFYSPGLPSELIEDDDDDDNNQNNPHDDAEHIKHGEHQSSYSLGALIEYNLNNHWSIQSGLTYIQKVSRINPKTVYAEDPGNGNIGYLFDFSSGYSYLPSKSNISVGDSAQTSRSTNVLQYISVPLQAKYIFKKGKVIFNASIGAAYNFLLKGKLETEVANDSVVLNETVDKIAGLKSGYISGLVGIGAEYPLTKKIAVCFNPSFDMALTSITQGAPVKSYPSFFAFGAGLHIRL